MQLYVMRHGQTNYNIEGLCNDDPSKDVHLTERGKQQAQIVAEKLKDKSFEKILVSELPRTRQTVEIINQHHHVNITVHRLINDIRSGFDSLPVADYQNAIAHDPLHCKLNNGESLLEHKQRIVEFITWLQTQNFASVLVVAHEESMRVFYAYYNQLDDDEMIKLAFDNCDYYQFSL